MDMKRILQALDGASTKPVEGASDMAKFLKAVDTSSSEQTLTEGSNPHKVALPVQMAMQHYQQPVTEKKQSKTSLISKYFVEAEETIFQAKEERRQLINQYASTIAQRVMMKESALKDKEDLQAKRKALQDIQLDPNTSKDPDLKKELVRRKHDLEKEAKAKKLDEAGEAGWGRTGMAGVGLQPIEEVPIEPSGDPNDPTIYGHAKANPMSLKGRIMQARAQLKELAQMAESDDLATWQHICKLAKGGMFMGLEQNLEQVRHGIAELAAKRKKGGVASRGIDKNIDEDNDPCWKDYKQIGTKKKGGKTVPNCVPKE